MPVWPFDPLRPLSYDVIVADPNWRFALRSEKGEAKSPQAHYDCAPLDWIKALPVDQLARGDALLWLWATWPMIREALAVMEAWGFRYITGGPWIKTTVRGKRAFGTGYVLRQCSEPFLLGKFGAFKTSRRERGIVETVAATDGANLDEHGDLVLEARIREHSRKPDEAFAMVERLVPQALNRVELFADRRIAARPGWDQWGEPHRAAAVGGEAAEQEGVP